MIATHHVMVLKLRNIPIQYSYPHDVDIFRAMLSQQESMTKHSRLGSLN